MLVEKSNEAEEEWVVKDDEWNNEYTINLKKRCCSCLYFQQNKAPCIHAIAVLHFNHQYHQVMSYVDEHYKSFNIFKSIPILNYDSIMSLGKSISSKSKLSVEQEKLIENLEIYDFKKAKLERRKHSTGEILTREETRKVRKEANGYEKMMYIERQVMMFQLYLPFLWTISIECHSIHVYYLYLIVKSVVCYKIRHT